MRRAADRPAISTASQPHKAAGGRQPSQCADIAGRIDTPVWHRRWTAFWRSLCGGRYPGQVVGSTRHPAIDQDPQVLIRGVLDMAAVCDICGKGPGFGKSVSHSHRRTSRRWDPNIQTRARRDPSRRQQEAHQRLHVVHQGRQGHPRLISLIASLRQIALARDVRSPRRLGGVRSGQPPVDRLGAHLLE